MEQRYENYFAVHEWKYYNDASYPKPKADSSYLAYWIDAILFSLQGSRIRWQRISFLATYTPQAPNKFGNNSRKNSKVKCFKNLCRIKRIQLSKQGKNSVSVLFKTEDLLRCIWCSCLLRVDIVGTQMLVSDIFGIDIVEIDI